MSIKNIKQYLKSCKFFQISSAIVLMKPCFLIHKCQGLFPYTILKNEIKLSNRAFVYSLLIGVISIINTIVLIHECNATRVLKFQTVEGLLQYNCYYIITTIIYVHACFTGKKKLPFVKKLMEVSSMLSKKEVYKLIYLIYTKDVCAYIFLLAQLPNIYDENILELLSKLFGMYLTIVVYSLNSQYCNYVLILRSCFKSINTDLYELKNKINKNKIEFVSSIVKRLQEKVRLEKLRKIEIGYSEVSNTVEKLNSVFVIQTIATVLYIAAEVTFGLYFFILHSEGKKSIDLRKQIWSNYFITSVTYHSVKIMIMVWTCQTTKNESSKSGLIVHDIILDTDDETLKTELNMFSLQLLQRRNEFTAKCITVNGQLLTAIVSGIATYLLILIQFLETKQAVSDDT